MQFYSEIQEEKALDRFRAEYEKLHRAIRKQHGTDLNLGLRLSLNMYNLLHHNPIRFCSAQRSDVVINNPLSPTCTGELAEIEKRLFKKCRELSNEIGKNQKKISAALKMNEEDQNTILALKADIDKCWIMVDDSQEKEAEAKEKIK